MPKKSRNFHYWQKSKHYFHQFGSENFENSYSDKLMDEDEINSLVQACNILEYNFCGVFAADKFPLKLSQNRFNMVNVSSCDSIGTHWTLLCRKNYIFADPLRQNLTSYKCLYNTLASAALDIQNGYQLLINQPIQTQNSILYCLFCTFVAHYIDNKTKMVKLSDVDVIRFAHHMMQILYKNSA